MDENKLRALREAGYTIPSACGTCANFRAAPAAEWGTCSAIPYDHLKHTGPSREASVNQAGVCPSWIASAARIARLGAFAQFSPSHKGGALCGKVWIPGVLRPLGDRRVPGAPCLRLAGHEGGCNQFGPEAPPGEYE